MEFSILSKTLVIELAPIIHGQPDTPILDMKSSQHYKKCRGCSVQYVNVLQNFARLGLLAIVKHLHATIIKNGLQVDLFIMNNFLNAYGKCGDLKNASDLFWNMHKPNIVSWNTFISAHGQHGKDAILLCEQMVMEGIRPNRLTFSILLGCCSLEEGKLCHALILSYSLESDFVVGTSLLNMYAKCGCLESSITAFSSIYEKDIRSWTVILAAYVQLGFEKEAFKLFQKLNIKPNKFTFTIILTSFSNPSFLAAGKLLHSLIIDRKLESDTAVGTALLNMYARCLSIEVAYIMFENIHHKDVLCWNAMIVACTQMGCSEMAVHLFQQMRSYGLTPNAKSFTAILDASVSCSAVTEGLMLHSLLITSGLQSVTAVGNNLLNMYSYHGKLKDACTAFDRILYQDLVSWSTVIAAYAQSGSAKEALQLFYQMQCKGLHPDEFVFLSILCACSHAGLVDEGCQYFMSFLGDYEALMMAEHYGCVVAILGHAGMLDEAEDFITKVAFEDKRRAIVAWSALLGGCEMFGDVRRGKQVAKHILELDPTNTSAYTVLSNIYAAPKSSMEE